MMPHNTTAPAPLVNERCASAINASVPPSPLLSARKQDHNILERNNEKDRPDNQRQKPKTRGLIRGIPGADRRYHRFAHRIERARADIAVHDADRANRERPKTRVGPRLAAD